MDWQTYKALCDRPDYWSAWMLTQCEELLGQMSEVTLLAELRRGQAEEALALPDGHHGPAATRIFQLSLDNNQRRRILAVIRAAIAQGITTPDTRKRGLGGFAEAWQEFVDYSG